MLDDNLYKVYLCIKYINIYDILIVFIIRVLSMFGRELGNHMASGYSYCSSAGTVDSLQKPRKYDC